MSAFKQDDRLGLVSWQADSNISHQEAPLLTLARACSPYKRKGSPRQD